MDFSDGYILFVVAVVIKDVIALMTSFLLLQLELIN